MDQTFSIENVKNYLRALYHVGNLKEEAEQFFRDIIQSENQCATLFSCLIEIIIQDNDTNLKKISTVLIRQMNFDFILKSIFLLNQKMDPNFYQTIEILTDFLAYKKTNELISLINSYLSAQQNLLIQKTIVQLLSSISYYIGNKSIEIKNVDRVFAEYYKYFLQTANALVSSEGLDQNEIIFLYYFAKSFDNTILGSQDYDFLHNFTCFCLNQKSINNPFKDLIECLINSYGKMLTRPQIMKAKNVSITDFFRYFDGFCQSTQYIPVSSLNLWSNFFIFIESIDSIPDNLSDLIINYVFPFIKFQPRLIDEDPEKFFDEFSPDYDGSYNCVPLYVLFTGLQLAGYYPPLFHFVFQFANSYFNQFINQNIFEICRLLIFVSRFSYRECIENQNNICNFYLNYIFPMISNINTIPNSGHYLAIAICEFIRTVNYKNQFPIFEDQYSLQIIINFLKSSVLVQFNEGNTSKLLFYFAFNAIYKISQYKYPKQIDQDENVDNIYSFIMLFNLTDNEIYDIFVKLYQINTEIQAESMNDLLHFFIKYMMTKEIGIDHLVNTIWDFCISFKDNLAPYLLNKYISLFELIFEYSRVEDREKIFSDIFTLFVNEMNECKEWLIINCYDAVLSLMLKFAQILLDSNEKVPYFINTVGQFIYNMLFSIGKDVYPDELFDINDFVSSYMTFGFLLVRHVDDPNICLELIVKQYLIPIVIKFDELHRGTDNEFSFESLNSPLIKFKGNDDIFQCLWGFNSTLQEMPCFDQGSKYDFLTSLIISKPSIFFEFSSQEQFFIANQAFIKTISYIHMYAIKEILEYLSKTNADIGIIQIFANSFYERCKEILEPDGTVTYNEDDDLFIDNKIFDMELPDVIDQIREMLKYVPKT